MEGAGRYAVTGDAKHIWLATNDLLPAAVKPMEQGYIDISDTWDAYRQAKEAIRVAVAITKDEDPKCGADGCLASGACWRLVYWRRLSSQRRALSGSCLPLVFDERSRRRRPHWRRGSYRIPISNSRRLPHVSRSGNAGQHRRIHVEGFSALLEVICLRSATSVCGEFTGRRVNRARFPSSSNPMDYMFERRCC